MQMVRRTKTDEVIVLLLYDYILTFPLELIHIWSGKFNLIKLIFFVNRYFSFTLIYGALLLDFIVPASDTVRFSLF